ncbi:MAG: hypothetical protein ACFFFG_01875 [Candidatus Thorarchaeota archaeon]
MKDPNISLYGILLLIPSVILLRLEYFHAVDIYSISGWRIHPDRELAIRLGQLANSVVIFPSLFGRIILLTVLGWAASIAIQMGSSRTLLHWSEGLFWHPVLVVNFEIKNEYDRKKIEDFVNSLNLPNMIYQEH